MTGTTALISEKTPQNGFRNNESEHTQGNNQDEKNEILHICQKSLKLNYLERLEIPEALPGGQASDVLSRQIDIPTYTSSLFRMFESLRDPHLNNCTYEAVEETADFLKARVPFKPKIGIICGSGLGSLAQDLKDPIEFPYSTIPNFPVSTVEGHAGKLIFGFLSKVPVVCMQGRFHFYEGYPLWKCAMPVRVMKLMGVSQLIATNAAGGLNSNYKVGDIMIVKDHINLMGFAGNNPLQGPNEERFGPRFPPMNKAYDRELIRKSIEIGQKLGLNNNIHSGVYTCLGGPNFETVAELKALKMLGCDAVGMSTVHEVITARHCNMDVLAFSLITNECIVEHDSLNEPNHEEVMDAAKMRENILKEFVSKITEYIDRRRNCREHCGKK